tara:strand:- start:33 stop:1115 length:1083 start_codon:yes stop_codon:yes gene_type:complete
MNQIVDVSRLIANQEKSFRSQNSFGLKFEAECLFAKQQIVKNDFTLRIAENNQNSLRGAILNVAAIGISLNPAQAHAYLVPRDGGICLDISYRGLVKLATDTGAIEWAKAVLVYEGDEFKWLGPALPPTHEADVFSPTRMDAKAPLTNLKGGYCIAKLTSGDYMVDVMTGGEILEVRDSSKAKKGPWSGPWAGEMAKKTLIKRGSKSWPQTSSRGRLDEAISIINKHEGLEEIKQVQVSEYLKPSLDQTEKYLALSKGDPIDFWLWYFDLDENIKCSLPGCDFERGTKGKMMAFFNAQLESGRVQIGDLKMALIEACEAGDEAGVEEIITDLPQNQIEALTELAGFEHHRFITDVQKQAA